MLQNQSKNRKWQHKWYLRSNLRWNSIQGRIFFGHVVLITVCKGPSILCPHLKPSDGCSVASELTVDGLSSRTSQQCCRTTLTKFVWLTSHSTMSCSWNFKTSIFLCGWCRCGKKRLVVWIGHLDLNLTRDTLEFCLDLFGLNRTHTHSRHFLSVRAIWLCAGVSKALDSSEAGWFNTARWKQTCPLWI